MDENAIDTTAESPLGDSVTRVDATPDAEAWVSPFGEKDFMELSRDLNMEDILIEGEWGTRGSISMIVGMTGTGKSILAAQLAACWAKGMECCGLKPTRPLRIWMFPFEDKEHRVARDRDDIFKYLSGVDFSKLKGKITVMDSYWKVGATFLKALNERLEKAKEWGELPDVVILNPLDCCYGGEEMNSNGEMNAFLKGKAGKNGLPDTEGLLAILCRYNVWGLIFAHTNKPPTRELSSWLSDSSGMRYKMSGAGAQANASRATMVFLPCPNNDKIYAFFAAKGGDDLGWTDENGEHTTKAFYKYGGNGLHYWQPVPKDEWRDLSNPLAAKATRGSTRSKPSVDPYIMKVVQDFEERAARGDYKGMPEGVLKDGDYKGVPKGMLEDEVKREYERLNPGVKINIKETVRPAIKKLVVDYRKLIQTDGTGEKDGRKYIGTPENMRWWTDKHPSGPTEGGIE